MENQYYKFIDGLRAIAVLMVFVFHLNPDWLTGGFIGVDIFFTISGFLITKIAITRSTTPGFYISFLIGRCRRLYPAYAVAIILTLLSSAIILLPSEIKELTKAAFTSSFVVSNVHYYLSSDYFDATLNNLALLHTWSLSVEWQFYLVYPLLLLVKLIRRNLLIFLCIIAIISLIATSIAVLHDKSGAFYLTHFRVYEFAIGGILAAIDKSLLLKVLGKINLAAAEVIGMFSIISLWLLAVLYTEQTLFPGFTAALVNFFTIAIIMLGMSEQKDLIFLKLLKLRPLTYVGEISYSLYLYHWPTIVFLNMYFLGNKELPFYTTAVITSFLLASTSYKYIENRYRDNTNQNNKTTKRIVLAATTLTVAALTISKHTNGFNFLFTDKQLDIVNVDKWGGFPGKCKATHASDKYYYCFIGEQDIKPTLLVIGDSHAQMLVWELDEKFREADLGAIFITKGGCPPLLFGVPISTSIDKEKCFATQQQIMKTVEDTPSLRAAFIASRWANYKDEKYDEKFGISNTNFYQRFFETLKFLRANDIEVSILQSIPEPGYSVPERLARADMLGLKIGKTPYDAKLELDISYFDNLINRVISAKGLMCDKTGCLSHLNNEPLYFDSNHTTRLGSSLILKNTDF